MPTDSLLLSIAVSLVFVLFAAVLAVIDHRTTRWQRERLGQQSAPARDPVHSKAA